MKIFFVATRADVAMDKTYDQIVAHIRSLGHSVDDVWRKYTQEQDAIDFEKAYERNMHSILKSDVLIAETTHISSGLGFIIASALKEKKPVLSLFLAKSTTAPSSTLRGSSVKGRLLKFDEYTDSSSMLESINKFLLWTKTQLDVKFIMILPAEIDHYLEWASREYKLHKSQIMRMSVEERMSQDMRWKNYQKL